MQNSFVRYLKQNNNCEVFLKNDLNVFAFFHFIIHNAWENILTELDLKCVYFGKKSFIMTCLAMLLLYTMFSFKSMLIRKSLKTFLFLNSMIP